MGYYIEVPRPFDKAQQLVALHDAAVVTYKEAADAIKEPDLGVVCVVHNQAFEAAGFCFNEAEFKAFAHFDGRIREWLIMDRAKAEELSGYR